MRAIVLLLTATAMAAPVPKWGSLPLTFEPNRGQASGDVRYLARGSSYILYLSPGEAVIAGRGQQSLRTKFPGANHAAAIAGEIQADATTNYLIGSDPTHWRTSVPNYERVRYSSIYSGIDLVYYGKDGHLEYDWIVAPGADPQQIRMTFDHSSRVSIDRHGDLVVSAGQSEYRHKKPLIYQLIAGKRIPVDGAWTLNGAEGQFRIGAYDHGKELVIDPPLIFSSYYGGNGLDYAYAVAVDSIGNTYIAGAAGSANLSVLGTEDAFVTKLSPNGSKMFTTFIGGAAADEAHGIAVDVQGNMYVTGSTGSLDFPVHGAIQPKTGGSGDVFVVKVAAAGAPLLYSTYLGGNANDSGSAIAIDSAGNAYIAGTTFSTDFPVQHAYQNTKGAQSDAFVAKLNPGGTAWLYVTYLGGNNVDQGNGIAVDAAGNAYVTGYTASTNFPVQSALRGSNAGDVDAFVTKLNPAGSALVYSTYLGGSATDYGTAIAVDASGNAYVTGIVTSDDFPLASPMDDKLGSHAVDDIFVSKLNPAGSALVYSTYLGGGSADDPYAIALDPAGNVYITGRTNSSDFPLTNPIQSTRFAFDMFVTEINAAGSARLFSTFIGGQGSESGRGIAVDSLGNIHVAGEGTSTDFPVVKPFQGANGGGTGSQDALVLLLGTATPSNGPVITTVSDNLVDGGPIVPGGWFYVKGTDLADVQRIWGGSDFSDSNTLPTDLNGVEVLVNGARVPVYFISPGQVNAQAPSNITSGSVSVQVVRLGLASNTLIAPVAQIQPSVYNYVVNSKAYAAALFLDYTLMGDPAVVPGTRKAKPNDVIQLYAAGLGPTPSTAVTSPIPISGVGVSVGGVDAQVIAAAVVAPGQFQINFVVPQLADGEYQITVSTAGKTSPPNVLFVIGQ
ncbi:MAG TPA: SBBP repeat-containing protein [Candidatus Limnocylindrales bacterium]|nr:SBBP repeat-containing protein [Candidatus Limnocylindrales bacterium]